MSAGAYARALLREAGANVSRPPEDPAGRSAAAEWARSGALFLTGRAEGPPVLPCAPLATCASGAGLALASLSDSPALAQLDAAALLGERAALEGLSRRGRVSPGGSCRLLRASDGWLAIALPRGAEDHRLLPAWLGVDPAPEPWAAIERALPEWSVAAAAERARLLGLPAAPATPAAKAAPWLTATAPGQPAGIDRPLRVADLTALWAGPLCGQLLALAGHDVVKVESSQRPDGALRGSPDLYRLLNGSKRLECWDFTSESGRASLEAHLEGVDVVLEAARPRALRQLGIVAEEWLARRPGRIWCSITGYGREAPGAEWVALGDDAAVAAGLSECVPSEEAPLFVADAVADPMTGLHAAVAVLSSAARGGGELLDLALSGVVARTMAHDAVAAGQVESRPEGWEIVSDAGFEPVLLPRARASYSSSST